MRWTTATRTTRQLSSAPPNMHHTPGELIARHIVVQWRAVPTAGRVSSRMNGFFESVPGRSQPEKRSRYRFPAWIAPPSGTLPGIAPLELVLARTEFAAVCVKYVAAYPCGFQIDLVTMTFNGDLAPLTFDFGPSPSVTPPLRTSLMETLRFGFQFADGSKATNLEGSDAQSYEKPSGPVLRPGGGGGGLRHWHQILWAWPLPPSGPLWLVCEWPAAKIALTRHELDAQLILDAASRAQVLSSEDHLPFADPPQRPGQFPRAGGTGAAG
jgi:hypothetical protein